MLANYWRDDEFERYFKNSWLRSDSDVKLYKKNRNLPPPLEIIFKETSSLLMVILIYIVLPSNLNHDLFHDLTNDGYPPLIILL